MTNTYEYIATDSDLNYYFRKFKCCKSCLVNMRCISWYPQKPKGGGYNMLVIHFPCPDWREIRGTYIKDKYGIEKVVPNILWI